MHGFAPSDCATVPYRRGDETVSGRWFGGTSRDNDHVNATQRIDITRTAALPLRYTDSLALNVIRKHDTPGDHVDAA